MSNQALKEAIGKVILELDQEHALKAIARETVRLPDSPFVQLLKMANHAGQVPSCEGCKTYRYEAYMGYEGMDEVYGGFCGPHEHGSAVEPAHFCSKWEPISA